MNKQKTYQRLTVEKKVSLIQQALNGGNVSTICYENGISRTIFYRWLNEYKTVKQTQREDSLGSKIAKGRKHWRKLRIDKEHEIIKLWRDNPDYSIRKIALQTEVSIGAVWNIIKDYRLRAENSGKKSIKRYIKKSYKVFSQNEKIALIKRHQSGESITEISRAVGVSRTIFYRWLMTYQRSKDKESALQNQRPSGENHWRFSPKVRDLLLQIVAKNPQFSLAEIASNIHQKGQTVSRSGLYYMLKRMQLTNYETRLAYAESGKLPINGNDQVIRIKKPVGIGYSHFSPRFAIMSLLVFLSIFTSLYLFTHDEIFKISIPINTHLTKIQTRKDNANAVVGKNQSVILTTTKQDFRWGAMSLNSPRSVYLAEDNVQLGFGVIDHAGNTICDAKISLDIFSSASSKRIEELTTDNGGIRQSGDCSVRGVTNTPDYIADIAPLGKDGTYNLQIKASTYDGEKDFNEKLVVAEKPDFEVSRISYPTRVYPVSIYPVEITINANKDFSGTISENLPQGTIASKISAGGVLFKHYRQNQRSIHWQVDLKKGKTYKISYNLTFPQIWPAFYEIGPLQFTDKSTDKIVFQDARYWQVVADALK